MKAEILNIKTKDKGNEYSYKQSINSSLDDSKIILENNDKSVSQNNCMKQTKLMIWKNYLVFRRSPKQLVFQIGTPIFICLLLFVLQKVLNYYNTTLVNRHPKIIDLTLPKCNIPSDCVTVGYGIIGDKNDPRLETVNNVISHVSKENNLELNKDIKLLTIGTSNDFFNYLEANQNKTQYGILFCLSSFTFENVSIPCNFEFQNKTLNYYSLVYNLTNSPNGFLDGVNYPNPIDEKLLKLKMSVDNGYLKHYAIKTKIDAPTISAQFQHYPSTPNRFLEGADIISSAGPFYFFFPPIITFVVILLEIIREKDMKLRKSLIIIGLKATPFWISWILIGVAFSFIVSLILVLTGMVFQFDFFLKTPFLITFFLFFIFNISMQFFAFFLSTILTSLKSAYTASYAFILIGLVMETFLSNRDIISYLYSDDLPSWVFIIKLVFSLYPPFNFSKIFADISGKSSSHFNSIELRWIKGKGYKWGDLAKRQIGKIRTLTPQGVNFDIPSTLETFGILLIDIAFFALLTWYFDHVLSSNRGKSYGKLFFLQKSYWNGSKKENLPVDSVHFDSTVTQEHGNSTLGVETVTMEKEKALRSEEKGNSNGLRILGVSKKYHKNGLCKKEYVEALKPTYLEIIKGELLTILGHNGAGKTTLINILTGNISTSTGTAKINNFDIFQDSGIIETLIGLCPQHDILWEELSAKEHIELYANLRNIDKNLIPEIVEKKLNEVNLKPQSDNEVKTFSGGMKRRLSILLSTVGEPEILFLDEPTTGLDPINKRFIWKMIQNLKQNKAIILTTHSMEEADFLSDRVGVIVEGNFKCFGSPLELKKLYGGGYLLTFICDHDDVQIIKENLKAIMPSANFLDSSGGCIILNLPFDKISEMKYFIKILNGKYDEEQLINLKGKIKECGMNYTTLEEIFLKITSKKLEDHQITKAYKDK